MTTISRGDIWTVQFDPSQGDEIGKRRPAVVLTAPGIGRMQLHIIVPVTGWRASFQRYVWMVQLPADNQTGLTKVSAADAFQVKSVSIERFQTHLGSVSENQLNQIAAAVALCVGYNIN
jgi:mRNA interferase MazF